MIFAVTLLYTLSCAGIAFQLHVCQDKLVAISVQQSLSGFRCCEEPTMDKDCCQDITKTVKLEQAGLKQIQSKLSALTAISLPVILFPLIENALVLCSRFVSPEIHPPPLLSSVPRHITLGVFLV